MRRSGTIIFILLILIIKLILVEYGCREKGTVPDNTPKPGKRDYVWSIDSVDYGNLPSNIQLRSIWGSSATDVWGAAGDAPDVRDCLWHYDGVKWSRATAGTPITELTGNKTVYAVWGSARNDVWAVGRKINQGVLSAFLMRFDGARWIDATPSNVQALNSILYNVYGVSKNDIWVGGDEYALHYNGSVWETHKIADSLTVVSLTRFQNSMYFHLGSPWGKDTIYIFMFKDSTLIIVDYTTLEHKKFGGGLFTTNSELKTITNGVIGTSLGLDGSIDTSGWRREFTTVTSFRERFVQGVKNLFAVGVWNLVYHYNGDDWKQIFINVPNHAVDPHSDFWGVWTDGNEVFICDCQNGIVYHGR
ncbi:MAG: hypothetical protein QME52_06250 [Bacteroidota bacterium]|nr:hypothetical protein [Bacteroidota bacterium]